MSGGAAERAPAGQLAADAGRIMLRNGGVLVLATVAFVALTQGLPTLIGLALGLVIGDAAGWGLGQVVSTLASVALTGPACLGLCAMSLDAARGRPPLLRTLLPDAARIKAAIALALLLGAMGMAAMALIGLPVGIACFALLQYGDEYAAVMLVAIAGALLLLPLCALAVFFAPAFFLLADERVGAWEAMLRSAAMVCADFRQWLALWGWLGLIHLAGLLLCCIGLLAATPWMTVALALQYDRVRVSLSR